MSPRTVLIPIVVALLLVTRELPGQTPAPVTPPDSARHALATTLVGIMRSADSTLPKSVSLAKSREMFPMIPAVVWDSMEARILRAVSGVQDSMVPLYAELYSSDELRGFILFFGSPLGRRYLVEQPVIALRMAGLIRDLTNGISEDVMKGVMIRPVRRP